MSKELDYYAVLGVDREASSEEIRAAAEALGSKFPKSAQDPSVNVAYRQLLEAYAVLGDTERRAAYESRLERERTGPLNATLVVSQEEIPSLPEPQLFYVLLTLAAPEGAVRTRAPVNVALVCDSSTSMRERRLQQVKTATKRIVEHLSPEDRIAVVAFSDRATVVHPAAPVENANLIKNRVDSIAASGGTEIFQGLKAGVDELQKAALPDFVNQLVLLTDGHTYGDEALCLELAETAAANQIMLSAFGLGHDWNDTFLDQLVAPSGGRSQFIDSPEEIISHLEEQIHGLGTTYAKNVLLRLEFPPDVECRTILKLAPYTQMLHCQDKAIKLGAVEGRAPLTVLLELTIAPRPVGDKLHLAFSLSADLPARPGGRTQLDLASTLRLGDGDLPHTPPPAILRAVQLLSLFRLNEKAWHDMENGNVENATKRMQRLTSRLLEAGHEQLAQQAQSETQRLERLGQLSPEGRKKLKFGTRSLLTKTFRLKRTDDGPQ